MSPETEISFVDDCPNCMEDSHHTESEDHYEIFCPTCKFHKVFADIDRFIEWSDKKKKKSKPQRKDRLRSEDE